MFEEPEISVEEAVTTLVEKEGLPPGPGTPSSRLLSGRYIGTYTYYYGYTHPDSIRLDLVMYTYPVKENYIVVDWGSKTDSYRVGTALQVNTRYCLKDTDNNGYASRYYIGFYPINSSGRTYYICVSKDFINNTLSCIFDPGGIDLIPVNLNPLF